MKANSLTVAEAMADIGVNKEVFGRLRTRPVYIGTQNIIKAFFDNLNETNNA